MNVRLEGPDGTVHPIELVYDGFDADGFHVWTCTTPTPPELLDGFTLSADEIPPRTKIRSRE